MRMMIDRFFTGVSENQRIKGSIGKTDEVIDYIYRTDNVYDLVGKSIMLIYNYEGIIMIFQSNQNNSLFVYYIIHIYFVVLRYW